MTASQPERRTPTAAGRSLAAVSPCTARKGGVLGALGVAARAGRPSLFAQATRAALSRLPLLGTVAGLDQSNFSSGAAGAGGARCRRDGAPTGPNLVRVEYYLGCDALQSFIA